MMTLEKVQSDHFGTIGTIHPIPYLKRFEYVPSSSEGLLTAAFLPRNLLSSLLTLPHPLSPSCSFLFNFPPIHVLLYILLFVFTSARLRSASILSGLTRPIPLVCNHYPISNTKPS